MQTLGLNFKICKLNALHSPKLQGEESSGGLLSSGQTGKPRAVKRAAVASPKLQNANPRRSFLKP